MEGLTACNCLEFGNFPIQGHPEKDDGRLVTVKHLFEHIQTDGSMQQANRMSDQSQ